MCVYQTWGELIVNAYALIMHSYFPVIQGNDLFISFCITLMLIKCITFVKIHCITCITLNYCLTETFPLGYRLYCRELGARWIALG